MLFKFIGGFFTSKTVKLLNYSVRNFNIHTLHSPELQISHEHGGQVHVTISLVSWSIKQVHSKLGHS